MVYNSYKILKNIKLLSIINKNNYIKFMVLISYKNNILN